MTRKRFARFGGFAFQRGHGGGFGFGEGKLQEADERGWIFRPIGGFRQVPVHEGRDLPIFKRFHAGQKFASHFRHVGIF